jgi:acyl-CoA synthetase (AMP-forming)/AMP-acid ligase II
MTAEARQAGRTELLSWLENPDAARGIYFARPGEGWDHWSYPQLAALANRAAWGLREAGIGPGDRVVLIGLPGPWLVAALFGSLLTGSTVSLLSCPRTFGPDGRYQDYLAAVLAAARPGLVACDERLLEVLSHPASASAVRVTVSLERLASGGDPSRPPPPPARPGLALAQFTSGSTGPPRGVGVSLDALAANITAIRNWLGISGADSTASWLPLHHDMGLTGCLLTSVTAGTDLWLMRPEDFIRSPLRYLRCFAVGGATLSAMSAFGVGYVVRRVAPASLAGLDFADWRAVIVGAERIDPLTLTRFHELLGPHGLPPSAPLPAYGLAEGTLAVTGQALGGQWEDLEIDPGSVAPGRRVVARRPGQRVTSCGRPLGGVTVSIVDPDRAALPDRTVGEIAVCGPAVATGYLDVTGPCPAASGPTSFAGGTLYTGDAGFMHRGQLYVLGRLGDSVKIRGRTLFADAVESTLTRAGVNAARQATAVGLWRDQPAVVAVLENVTLAEGDVAAQAMRSCGEGAVLVLIQAPAGAVPRTSSGKPRRQELWRRFLAGEYEALARRLR